MYEGNTTETDDDAEWHFIVPKQHDALKEAWCQNDIELGMSRKEYVHPWKRTMYHIDIFSIQSQRHWTFGRTNADFEELNKNLCIRFPSIMKERGINFPTFSSSSFGFPSIFDSSNNKSQDLLLNFYLHRLLECKAIYTRNFFIPGDGDLEQIIKPFVASPMICLFDSYSNLSEQAKLLFPLPELSIPNCSNSFDKVVHSSIKFGNAISLQVFGGISVSLRKRGTAGGKQKLATVAAGFGAAFFTGPVSTLLAAGAIGNAGKYQLTREYFLVAQSDPVKHDSFFIEYVGQYASPNRSICYGDVFSFRSVSLKQCIKIVTTDRSSSRGYMALCSQDHEAALFRFISPLGLLGEVTNASHVCIQVLNGKWTNSLLGSHKDFVVCQESPVVFQVRESSYCDPPLRKLDPLASQRIQYEEKLLAFSIATYNVWFLPDIVTLFTNVSPNKELRAVNIPQQFPEVDVIVFCEAFCSRSRRLLVNGMKKLGYIYETKPIGQISVTSQKVLNGGVFAMSRYPINYSEEMLFKDTTYGDDAMADKGVLYIQVRKDGRLVHVFGTHTQAWESMEAVTMRKRQLTMLKSFIDSKCIPKWEPVFIVGDLNVNQFCPAGSYNEMLQTLQVEDPPLLGPYQNTFDARNNVYAKSGPSSGGKNERLDYVLYSKQHLQPLTTEAEILPLRSTQSEELSDHYPIIGRFTFQSTITLVP